MLGVQGVFLIGPRSPINNDTRVQDGTRLGLPAIHLSHHQVCRKACFLAQRRLLNRTVQGLVLLRGFVFLPCPEIKASSRNTSRNPGAFQSRLEFPSGADLSAREAHTPGTTAEGVRRPLHSEGKHICVCRLHLQTHAVLPSLRGHPRGSPHALSLKVSREQAPNQTGRQSCDPCLRLEHRKGKIERQGGKGPPIARGVLLCLRTEDGHQGQEVIFQGRQRQGGPGAGLSSLLLILDAAPPPGHHAPSP